MLPDYPVIRSLIDEFYGEIIRRSTRQHLGIFSDVRRTQIHEGMQLSMERRDGSTESIPMKHIHAETSLKHDIKDIESLDMGDVLRVLVELGRDFAQAQSDFLINRIDEGVTAVGNVISSKAPMVEQIFQMIEKVEMDFDEEGIPSHQQVFSRSREKLAEIAAAWRQIKSDPQLRTRFEKLMQRKKSEWDDREVTRNLVE